MTQNHREAANKALVEEKFAAWAAGTGSPFDLLAEDASWTITGTSAVSKTYPSRISFLADVIQPFNGRLKTGLKPTIRNLYADADTVIIFFDGTGIAKDDRPYANTYAWFMRFEGRMVVEVVAFFDNLAFNELWRRVDPETV